jgi:UPF0755 protein
MQAEPETPFKKGFFRNLISGLVTSIILVALLTCLFLYFQLQPPADGAEVNVTIPKGAGTKQIAQLLEQAGLVRDDTLFYYRLLLSNEGGRFKAGDYVLRPGMGADELIAALNGGGRSQVASFKVTVPEGMTVRQLADRLENQHGISGEQFLAEAEAVSASGDAYSWLKPLAAKESLEYPLEGYLFPATYMFRADATARQMIERMLEQTDKKLEQLPNGWQKQLDKLGVSVHEMLTVASLVEREVVVAGERAVVAGVIYNRLRLDMPLQIDATVQYLLPQQKERLLYKDLEIESAYNTYRNKGLPPGPIANPGLAAMEAACFPATTEYLFYVTRKDGTPGHWFAKTFAEHKRNIARSKE